MFSLKQIILLVLLLINGMSGFVAENYESKYACSKSIQDYLIKENVTDANLAEEIQKIEKVQTEFFDNLCK